jgi:long-chain fatty acid transport protein
LSLVTSAPTIIEYSKHALRFLAIIISGVSALNVSANGFGLASQDAFASARGEAFAATADNASAIYYNPAGITQLEGNNVRGGLYGISLNQTFKPTNGAPNSGNTYRNSDDLATVPQLFFTYTPKDWPVSFGLGVYAPYGGKISWPQDTGFRAVALDGSLKYFRINPVIALKLAPNLSIGGGVMVDYAKIDLESGLSGSTRFPDFFRFTGSGWSVGYNLGVLWQPIDQISIGATFRSETAFTMDGHTEFEQLTAGILDTTLPAHADFTFPVTGVFGISYRPTPRWNLEFDANYTDWNSFGMTTIYQIGSVPFGGTQNPQIAFNWQPSWMYEFGVTRYFDSGWHVSAGYVYNGSSVPDTYFTPLAADLDRHFFNIGAGRKGKRFDCDIAYQLGYGPTHTVSGSTPSSLAGVNSGESADGKYGFNSQAVLVTVGMHF